MIVGNIRITQTFKLVGKWLIVYFLFSALVCVAYMVLGWPITLPAAEITIIGTALSILMGFRVDAAYQRWWEARTIWGAVVNNSRSFAREVKAFVGKQRHDDVQKLIYRQIGFVEAMGKHLRKQTDRDHLERLLSPEEFADIKERNHVPNTLLMMNLRHLKEIHLANELSTFEMVQIENIIHNLTDELGKAERIKNTPFPVPYGYFSWLLVHIFAFMIPFSMVEMLGYFTPLVSAITAFIFLMIEQIAMQIQDPFENKPNDTPMTTLAKNIEIDLREILDEKPLPRPIKPKAGLSM